MNNQNNLKEEVKRYIAECGYDGLDTEMEVEDIARHFAKWKEEQILEKACEWLKENADKYIYKDVEYWGEVIKLDIDDLTETFKQAMMEE